jgi:hypothetical protein
VILRGLLLLAGAVALAGSIAVDRPERFAITAPCGILTIVVAAGAIAADAVPLRRVPLACSVATLGLAFALVLWRAEVQIPIAAAIVALQVAAVTAQSRGGASRTLWPR